MLTFKHKHIAKSVHFSPVRSSKANLVGKHRSFRCRAVPCRRRSGLVEDRHGLPRQGRPGVRLGRARSRAPDVRRRSLPQTHIPSTHIPRRPTAPKALSPRLGSFILLSGRPFAEFGPRRSLAYAARMPRVCRLAYALSVNPSVRRLDRRDVLPKYSEYAAPWIPLCCPGNACPAAVARTPGFRVPCRSRLPSASRTRSHGGLSAVASRPVASVASVVRCLQGHTSGVRAAMFTQHRPNVIVSGAADKTLR